MRTIDVVKVRAADLPSVYHELIEADLDRMMFARINGLWREVYETFTSNDDDAVEVYKGAPYYERLVDMVLSSEDLFVGIRFVRPETSDPGEIDDDVMVVHAADLVEVQIPSEPLPVLVQRRAERAAQEQKEPA